MTYYVCKLFCKYMEKIMLILQTQGKPGFYFFLWPFFIQSRWAI